MTKNLNNLDLKKSNYFMNIVQNNQNKGLNHIKNNQKLNSNSNKIPIQKENSKKIIANITEYKSIKKLSSKKTEKNLKSILSPNSKGQISYLKHFNNNSIYYSNHKKNKYCSIYGKPNSNTDVKSNPPKCVILRNKTYIHNLINLKKNKLSLYKKIKHINEDSKNNSNIEDIKQSNIFFKYNILNRNNCAKTEYNFDKKNLKQIIKRDNNSKPKNRLLNMISSKNIFEHSQKNENIHTLNTFRLNKPYKISVIKIYKFPEIIIPEEYKKISKIGSGSFGKIFKAKWNKNNNHYAMKEMHFQSKENILYLRERVKYITDFQKNSKCDGIIKIYGDSYYKKGKDYFYYEIMELAERDWEQEIKIRKNNFNYYSEKEILNIMFQLIKTLSLLQQHHITHRDIKLQNILLVNKKYKICDFGESRKLSQKGTIVQPVRGSELYMSPILFSGLNEKLLQVKHNTYKSDVFSLGMCILYAVTLTEDSLCDIRELNNMNDIRKILENYLNKKYSSVLIEILLFMLENDEKKRPDFIQLEKIISKLKIKN